MLLQAVHIIPCIAGQSQDLSEGLLDVTGVLQK